MHLCMQAAEADEWRRPTQYPPSPDFTATHLQAGGCGAAAAVEGDGLPRDRGHALYHALFGVDGAHADYYVACWLYAWVVAWGGAAAWGLHAALHASLHAQCMGRMLLWDRACWDSVHTRSMCRCRCIQLRAMHGRLGMLTHADAVLYAWQCLCYHYVPAPAVECGEHAGAVDLARVKGDKERFGGKKGGGDGACLLLLAAPIAPQLPKLLQAPLGPLLLLTCYLAACGG